jgi:sphingolipid delta-4 desaturase
MVYIVMCLIIAVRPMMVRAQTFTTWHLANWIFQFGCMGIMVHFWGPNPFYYFFTCLMLSGSLHPMAGHFLAEHYVFVEGFETYSYYGGLNL